MISTITRILGKYGSKPDRLMDILIDVQQEEKYISEESKKLIAQGLNLSMIDVEQCMSFYHFFTNKPTKHSIYLNDSVMSVLSGRKAVQDAFEAELGCKQGEINANGIGLFTTSCIGMSDQEPAAIIDNVIFPSLTPEVAVDIVKGLNEGKKLEELYHLPLGDGLNGTPILNTMINSNIRKAGLLLNDFYTPGTALKTAVNKSDLEVIGIIKTSGLRGRGGAGFPTGMKWEFCRASEGRNKYIICNADEGEPGTFKDRVLLTEKFEMLLEGMALAAYSIGAKEGIIYLRYEYIYMKDHVNALIDKAYDNKLLGKNILDQPGFDFDVRIQFGGGAYVCGEESALIESMEGKRGEPRLKPPFPVQKGYLQMPTSVNNVETFCKVCKIVENGGEWYRKYGTKASVGTKLLSISGNCTRPGIYEVEWGTTIHQMLEMVGAKNTQAVQVGGPSGALVGPASFGRKICYTDLSTGGSMMVFDHTVDLIKDVVLNFTDFFIEESCGSCVSCRITTQQLRKKLQKIITGKGVPSDLNDLKEWSVFTLVSRCGLGQTAANPITTSIENFLHLYEEKINFDKDFESCFDMESAVAESCAVVGRTPNL